ncbi:unnamed protein product [Polarella glacialis]|uniref:Uncharacterized protein n=1 Tax=Polarella glacialis TaxID=89957 RepID=A0A813HC18_POLGL|nr:unnamed protein product [Polarella glacialis]
MLARTINEGSTIVMKAINNNNPKQVKRALACAPRGKRATWTLNITVGTQSISPLIWSIESGATEAARVIIHDLLTIRADRDRYYFGVNELFERHPDIMQVLSEGAPTLLPTLLDGLIWRCRTTVAGQRRVNCYLKHLLVAHGGFADASFWLAKLQDPALIIHPLLVSLTDLVWSRLVHRTFLVSKIWLLFTTMVFLLSQSILKNMSNGRTPTETERYAGMLCRAFVYLCSMCELIYSRTKHICLAIKAPGGIVLMGSVPVPRKYLEDWREVVSVLLTIVLIAMFVQEPILFCLQTGFSDGEIFTQGCSEALALLVNNNNQH